MERINCAQTKAWCNDVLKSRQQTNKLTNKQRQAVESYKKTFFFKQKGQHDDRDKLNGQVEQINYKSSKIFQDCKL